MFEVLVESGVGRSGSLGPRVVSLSIHAVGLIAGGLGWRQAVTETVRKPEPVTIDIYQEPRPTTPAGAETNGGSEPAASPLPRPSAPIMAPTSIPPVTPDLPGTDAATSPQTLVRRELWGNRGVRDYGPADSTYLAGEVDQAVTVLKAVPPEYPRVMAAAGLSGEVRVEFVVDTTGKCEPRSARVVTSTAQAFEGPAIDAVVATVYRAARVRGQAVRQLVQQRVTFRLK